jgi:hypothetical protein
MAPPLLAVPYVVVADFPAFPKITFVGIIEEVVGGVTPAV